MKRILKIALFVGLPFVLRAQNIDSLKKELNIAKNDSLRYSLYKNIYNFYEESNRDSALRYAGLQLQLAKKNNQKLLEVIALDNKAYQQQGMGRYAEAYQCLLEAFAKAQDKKNDNANTWPLFTSLLFHGDNRLLALAYTHHIFAVLLWQTQNNEQQIVHFREARRISKDIGHTVRQMLADMNLGRAYIYVLNKPDSALLFEKEAEGLAFQSGFKKYLGQIYALIAEANLAKGNKQTAKEFYYKSVQYCIEHNNLVNLSNAAYYGLSKFYLAEGEKDSALYYALKNLQVFRTLGSTTGIAVNFGTIYENIYRSYRLRNEKDSVFKYQELALAAKDSLYRLRIKNLTDFQNVNLQEQMRLQAVEKQKVVYENKVRTYGFIAGLGIVLFIALILYRNNLQKHKAKIKIENAYDELKATQQQLIQSEKMASLGELTAGIAHEIQNPLNFVNNFSEVNKELIEELKIKNEKLKIEDEEVSELINDLKENSEKINHHGKRADAIVKGMLQHSRKTSDKKEPTDINALVDEYVRLSYHGLRAKDKSFNATIETNFDESIGKLEVIPQDIGRVLLNLLNNAFYAVNEKKKACQAEPGEARYEPTVSVSTKHSLSFGEGRGEVKISVKDNGNGIPQNIVDKIFQPFFTTKPTGSGTGLGLSLSYDIIKAHGGEIKVQTKEGEGSEFIIQLHVV